MKSASYVIYDLSTGHIVRQVQCPEYLIALQLAESEGCLEGACDDSASYVDVEAFVVRPKRGFSLSGLPLPCTVRIEGAEYKCTTQPVFEFDVPGEYRIEVDAGPRFLKKEFTYAYPPRSR